MLVGAMVVRLLHQGSVRLASGLAALAAGDQEMGLADLEDAAKAYLPFSPYSARGLEELAILAKTAQMRGDTQAALHAWEVLRRSVLATRHLWIPNRDVLERADQEIATLRQDSGESAAQAAAAVALPSDPSASLSLLLSLGFILWILGVAALAAGVGSPDGLLLTDSPQSRKFAWTMCVAGLALWLAISAVA